jgi:hypothetical protein
MQEILSVLATIDVPDPCLWWPRGFGEQPLYPVEVTLAGRDRALDRWQSRVGFRTVRVDTTPDADGTAFTIVVNDQPVFARGANWIPDDAFPARVTRDRYAARIRQATEVVTREPWHESAWHVLIRAHREAGDRAAALQAVSDCRRALKEELGVPPSEPLLRLARSLGA